MVIASRSAKLEFMQLSALPTSGRIVVESQLGIEMPFFSARARWVSRPVQYAGPFVHTVSAALSFKEQ